MNSAEPKKLTLLSSVKEGLEKGECLRLKVTGNSMYPILKPNDYITISSNSHYRFGDLVSFQSHHLNTWVVHRYLGMIWTGRAWKNLLIPENGKKPDVLVSRRDILGKVVTINDQPISVSYAKRLACLFAYFYWSFKLLVSKIIRN